MSSKVKRRNLVTVLISAAAVVAVYSALNAVVVQLFLPKEIVSPRKTEDYQVAEGVGRYCLSSSSPTFGDDIFQSVKVEGWAFLNNQEENEEKEIIAMLCSTDHPELCYLLPTEMSSRPDVYNAYADTGEIRGLNHGFNVSFTPVLLQDGRYQLAIYVYENEAHRGSLLTNVVFEKEGRSFLQVDIDGE